MKAGYAGVPMTKISQKKGWRKIILENQKEFMERLNNYKRDMREEIEKQMEERHGDFIHQIQSALDGVIAMKEMFIAKGLFTREEYNAQKAKMREKK